MWTGSGKWKIGLYEDSSKTQSRRKNLFQIRIGLFPLKTLNLLYSMQGIGFVWVRWLFGAPKMAENPIMGLKKEFSLIKFIYLA